MIFNVVNSVSYYCKVMKGESVDSENTQYCRKDKKNQRSTGT
jgi:hypothetical protein